MLLWVAPGSSMNDHVMTGDDKEQQEKIPEHEIDRTKNNERVK